MTPKHRQPGMALVNAIFLIVVLALLGAMMVTLTRVEHDTAAKSIISTRVYYGAKAGLEWGIQRAVAAGACAASTTFTLTQGALNGVGVTVTCTSTTHGAGNVVYYLTSVATAGTFGASDYAERRMEATVSSIP